MLRQVWIDGWQMQCCGDPFRVGQQVQFSTSPEVDREFLGVVLGDERAGALTDYYENHHELDVGPMAHLVGTVGRIDAISCQYELRDRAMYPMAGTTQVLSREEATGWEPEDEETNARFVGYIMTVEVK